jgi:hypothetical protein
LVDQLSTIEGQQRPLPVERITTRAAVADLEHWAHVWAKASLREKNDLLTAAGLRIYVSRKSVTTGKRIRGRSSAIVEIRVKDPVFGAALAIALGDRVKVTSGDKLIGWTSRRLMSTAALFDGENEVESDLCGLRRSSVAVLSNALQWRAVVESLTARADCARKSWPSGTDKAPRLRRRIE